MIALLAPNGGEAWIVGEKRVLTWASRGKVGDVTVELSVDGGLTWTTLVGETENDGEEEVRLPLTSSSEVLVRVGETDGDPSDESDAAFSLETVVPADSPATPARGYFLGVLPSPAAGQDFAASHALAAQDAEWFPVWGRPTPFWEKAEDFSGAWGDEFIELYGRQNGMMPLVHFSFIADGMTLSTPPELPAATLSDPAWREAYREAVLDVVRAVRPLYLSVGNEVNRWHDAHGADPGDPDGFQHFVSLYEEIYDDVKAVSPETRVFCIFAREHVDEHREFDLDPVFALFDPDKLDLVVLTSYPYALQGVNRPADLADDYYSREIPPALLDKPFGFTELCWTSIADFGGEQAQADLLADAVDRLTIGQGLDLHLVGWPWLTDLDVDDDTGLIEDDGTPKAAHATWGGL
jgi:hypothetical protein